MRLMASDAMLYHSRQGRLGMTRNSRGGGCRSAGGMGRSLLTLVVLMLVGMGFTLMSATAFAGDDHYGRLGGVADTVPVAISRPR